MTLATPLLRAAGGIVSPAGGGGKLTILTYHRVLPERDPLLNDDQIDLRKFATQMQALSECFSVLPLPQALDRLKSGTLPARAAAITFDDGYHDNYSMAWPILRRLRLPATFFVCTGFLNDGLMFNDVVIEALRSSQRTELDLSWLGLGVQPIADSQARRLVAGKVLNAVKYLPFAQRDAACERVRELARPQQRATRLMMTEDEVRQLAAHGMTIGAHTHTHPILTQVDLPTARQEIEINRRLIGDLVGERPTVFAYPNGRPDRDYAYQHVQLLKEMGLSAAVSTAWGIATRQADFHQLPRFSPWDSSANRFVMRLLKNAVRGQSPALTSPEAPGRPASLGHSSR